MNDEEKTIVFKEFGDVTEAYVVQGLFEANDIPCFLSNQDNVYISNFYSSMAGIQLRIFEKDKARAEQILKDAQENAPEKDE